MMKRYRNFKLSCNNGQTIFDLLDLIEQMSIQKSFVTERYSSFQERDCLAVIYNDGELPCSKIIMCGYEGKNSVSVVNIFPLPQSGVSQLEPHTYNLILEAYYQKVLSSLVDLQGNRIETDNEDYAIEEIIPLSFPKLKRWLGCFPLSGHQLDTNRWYDFVISLHKNGESLSLDDFGKYIEENYHWKEEDILKFELKLESQIDLLEYYDEHREC